MAKSKTVNAKLYKIQDSIILDKADNDALISEIVQTYVNKSGNSFEEIDLSDNSNVGGWSARLFSFTTDNKPPYWHNFLTSIVAEEADLESIKIQYSSFVLFVFDNECIYVISKGYYGHFLLQEYIDSFFGMEVLARLVKKSTTEIRQIEQLGLFGIELGSQRFFRENYSLASEDDFGKIYKTMLASIDKEDFEKLGIVQKRETTKKLSINGSSSLEVSSNFSYNELVTRIIKIKELLNSEEVVELNQFYRLPLSELRPLKTALNDALLEHAFEQYIKKENIDFFSPNIFDYLKSVETQFYNEKNAAALVIEFSSSSDFQSIILQLNQEQIIDVSNVETFKSSLKESKGEFRLTNDGVFSFPSSLDNWVCGEVEYLGKKYFKMDNSWYAYRESLDSYSNSFFQNFDFEASNVPENLKPWLAGYEGPYNESYRNIDNFIVGDRAYLNHIEMADIIKVTDERIFMYHVKKGLGQDTRILINQINNAARSLTFYKDEENSIGLKSYYQNISNKHYGGGAITFLQNGTPNDMSEAEFVNLFKSNRKFSFVFVYGSNSLLSIKDEIISTESRIAKLSLIYLVRDMKSTDFQLLFERISCP
ncbi:DUF6119 family protein [Flavobacterium coralii]|uniref:DUF6119 family protein n=1 Tax=Flavobacterium coralii TaxID=2838017 RepID=UPI000C68347B|nr:hypothetical protein [Flavobacterium sp.]|tara:strand:+ start:2252 stop:4036 length:1785 start_codon:yes stop_codon:yes gene_type:complete